MDRTVLRLGAFEAATLAPPPTIVVQDLRDSEPDTNGEVTPLTDAHIGVMGLAAVG